MAEKSKEQIDTDLLQINKDENMQKYIFITGTVTLPWTFRSPCGRSNQLDGTGWYRSPSHSSPARGFQPWKPKETQINPWFFPIQGRRRRGGGQGGHEPPPFKSGGGGHKWVCAPPLLGRANVLISIFAAYFVVKSTFSWLAPLANFINQYFLNFANFKL